MGTAMQEVELKVADLNPSQEIEFIEADEFQTLSESPGEQELVKELISKVNEQSVSVNDDSLIAPLISGSAELLSGQEERLLFRRMNYVKFQAEALRSTLSQKRPSKRKLKKIAALLEEARCVRKRIAESNIRLVASVSRKYSKSAQEFQEFVSDGLLILLGAVEKFDYSRGFRFSTYATHAVQRHLFRVSQRSHKRNQRFVLTPGEILAETTGFEEEIVEPQVDPAVTYRRLMESASDRLSEREIVILNRRFGTDGQGAAQTLREVAAEMGISKERVRQIQIAAIEKLRDVAQELNLAPVA